MVCPRCHGAGSIMVTPASNCDAGTYDVCPRCHGTCNVPDKASPKAFTGTLNFDDQGWFLTCADKTYRLMLTPDLASIAGELVDRTVTIKGSLAHDTIAVRKLAPGSGA